MEYIEISGIGFPNRGAELLFRAISAKLRELRPAAVPVCLPGSPGTGSVSSIINQGGMMKAGGRVMEYDLVAFGNLLPSRLVRRYRIVRERDCSALLDASGFAYSDQWGVRTIARGARLHRRYGRTGRPTVLLPQAYGPFDRPGTAAAAKKLFEAASLVFARDDASQRAALQVAPDVDVRVFPDVTIGYTPYDSTALADRVGIGIVPNVRMLDKTAAGREAYVSFLSASAETAVGAGEDVIWINHEGAGDRALIEEARRANGGIGEVFDPADAVAIKRRIGQCRGVISSRYHGLVSALSQGVPVLGTTWSHKYLALLEDFSWSDYLVTDLGASAASASAVEHLLEAVGDHAVHTRLQSRSRELKGRLDGMWSAVTAVLVEAVGGDPAGAVTAAPTRGVGGGGPR